MLIEGESGAGKSDLALRLIDRGAMLVSDDYTLLTRSGDDLLAAPPATIAGRIEVRGLGIVPLPFVADVPVRLLVRLTSQVERMPEAETRSIDGITVPATAVDPHAPSAAIKVELALQHVGAPAP